MFRYVLLVCLLVKLSRAEKCFFGVECPPEYKCVGNMCVSQFSVAAPISVCSTNPCQGDCSCIASNKHAEGFFCSSAAGYIGKTCNIPPPTLLCESNTITIMIPERFVREYDSTLSRSYLYMGPSYDQAVVNPNSACAVRAPVNGYYTISIPMPFSACQTSYTREMDSNVFTNQLWLNQQGALFDIPIPAITWICTYNDQYSIVTSLRPAVDPIRNELSGVIQQQATVELCKVGGACPNACPPLFTVNDGALYTVAEIIHVTLSVQPPQNTVVYVKQLYLSCQASAGSNDISLVTNGCSANVLSTSINLNGMGNTVCLSFRVPRFKSCTSFYIHGELSAADPATLQRCSLGNGYVRSAVTGNSSAYLGGSRKKRMLVKRSSEEDSSVILIGPIYVIEGEVGLGSSDTFPNSSVVTVLLDNEDHYDISGITMATVVIGGFAFILLCVAIITFIYECHKT
uniref:ZP domain-containing protein n=2 Tax=Ciona intestinalis TaxID=7719 RepID=F6VWX3_CIOIN